MNSIWFKKWGWICIISMLKISATYLFFLKLLTAFRNAVNGLLVFFKSERNGKIQLLAAVIAVVMGCWVHLPLNEWMWVIACIATVLSLEMMNSAVEKLCNVVHPAYDPAIKVIKDLSAAAVLCAAIFSAVTGAIIFIPKILKLL